MSPVITSSHGDDLLLALARPSVEPGLQVTKAFEVKVAQGLLGSNKEIVLHLLHARTCTCFVLKTIPKLTRTLLQVDF